MRYEVVEYPMLEQRWIVWMSLPNGSGCVVKAFKTRKGAENWIKRNA